MYHVVPSATTGVNLSTGMTPLQLPVPCTGGVRYIGTGKQIQYTCTLQYTSTLVPVYILGHKVLQLPLVYLNNTMVPVLGVWYI
jgi:hypothetical protein